MSSGLGLIARGLFGLAKQGLAKKPKRPGIPDLSDRISIDGGGSVIEAMHGLFSGIMYVSALFPFAVYEVMDHLFKTEPYLAKFKRDTLSLGNSGHEIEIDAPTEQRAQAVLQVVNDFAARCSRNGGADGLFNGKFSQLCRTGGLCVEYPPYSDRSGIMRAYLIPLRTCRWRRAPGGELELGQLQGGVFVPLNPVQTAYLAAETFDENPYPIPPALAALTAVATNQKFEEGLRAWTKKVGAFGLLQATAERPEPLDGEADDQYWQRTKGLLKDFTQSIASNMTEGVAAAWDNVNFKFTNTNAAAAGAKDMAQMILQGLFAGLLRDPVFFGHNWGTTETFATVVYRIMAAQIRNFQLCVKRAYEHGLRLELALNGMGDVGVSVQFDLSDTLDEFMASEAAMMERSQFVNEYAAQICTWEEVREKLGYDDPKAKSGAFVASFEKNGSLYVLRPPKKQWTGIAHVGAGLAPPKGAASGAPTGRRIFLPDGHYALSQRQAANAARQYLATVRSHLSEAAQTGVDAVYEWARVRDIPAEESFVQEAMTRFLDGAEGSLDSAALERIAKEHLSTVWQWARYEDDSVFGMDWDRGSRGVGIGIGVDDTTAINYMSRVDRFYVSKYVSGDEITSRKIQSFMREQYIEKGLGTSKKNLTAFRAELGDLAEQVTEHRARVIIDTGVSRCENWGELLALSDEGFTIFRIAGPWDGHTCEWCYAVRGKEFRVIREVTRINHIIESGDEDISRFSQFLTSRFSGKAGLEELGHMDAEAIQASGMVAAPIHPLCRHRTIAVVEAAIRNRRGEWHSPWATAGRPYTGWPDAEEPLSLLALAA